MSEDKFYIKDLQPIREFCLNSEKEDIYKYIYSLQQEKQQLKQALLDIQNILATKQKAKGLTNQLLNIQEQSCLDIVNKTLGSDSND